MLLRSWTAYSTEGIFQWSGYLLAADSFLRALFQMVDGCPRTRPPPPLGRGSVLLFFSACSYLQYRVRHKNSFSECSVCFVASHFSLP